MRFAAFQAHVRRALRMLACAGVEWWLQEQDGKDRGKELHTGDDMVRRRHAGTAHPALSAVFEREPVGRRLCAARRGRAGAARAHRGRVARMVAARIASPTAPRLALRARIDERCIAPTEAQSRRRRCSRWAPQLRVILERLASSARSRACRRRTLPPRSRSSRARRAARGRARGARAHPFADDASAWRAQRAPPWVERGLDRRNAPDRLPFHRAERAPRLDRG